MYLKAFIALEEALREAQGRTRDIVSNGINDAAGRYFRAITQGKYDRVEVSLGDRIEVRVKEAVNLISSLSTAVVPSVQAPSSSSTLRSGLLWLKH